MTRRSWSLGTRLGAVCALIALIGVAAVAVASWRELSHSLDDRADRTIQSVMQMPAVGCLENITTSSAATTCSRSSPGAPPQPPTPQGVWVELVSTTGVVLANNGSVAPPPSMTSAEALQLRSRSDQPPRTVGDDRVAVHVTQAGATLLVGASLNDVRATLDSLVRIELVVGGIAGVLVLLATLVAVRSGLRPLRRIAARAGSMAEPEHLGERLPGSGGAREIDQLAAALNAMLERMDAAFDEQRRTQQRLRRFVGDASHELRTPITAIRGQAQLLTSGASSAGELTDAERIARIDEQAGRLGELVDGLLDLARFDDERPLELERVDIADAARAAVGTMIDTDPARSWSCNGPASVELHADPLQVRRVLDNLLGNASAHTPPGSRIEVSCAREGADVVVRVDDDGPGIDPADRPRALDRFWRSARSRADGEPGTGLGLALVHAIAAAHGGDVRLDASPLGGLRVEVRLPAA